MQAFYLTDCGPELVVNLPIPVPGSGEALLRPRLTGICGTDLALIVGAKGGYRGVLGHEYVAEVVADQAEAVKVLLEPDQPSPHRTPVL